METVKSIYVLTIATFVIMLVAFGISAFYEAPEHPRDKGEEPYLMPRYPSPVIPIPDEGTPEYEDWQKQNEEYEEWQQENQRRNDQYQQDSKDYKRNVFFIAYPLGLIFVVLGLQLQPRLDMINPGFLLGGIGTMIYAIAQSGLADQIRFIGIAVGLAVLIYVGYRTFLEKKTIAGN